LSATGELALALVRAQARRLALWMEFVWRSGQASPDQGPAIGPAEVARLLAPAEMREAEARFFAESGAGSAEAEAAALAGDAQWVAMLSRFGLDAAEAAVLVLAVAVELDPGLGRVMGYLHDDGRLTQPTPWLAARLAGVAPAPFAGAALRRWLLAAPVEEPARLMTPWLVDPAVAASVAGAGWTEPAIAAVIVRPEEVAALPVLHAAAMARLESLADLREGELVGGPGMGKRTLAAQFAARRGKRLLAVDAGRAGDVLALTRALRWAAMTGAVAYFANADAVTEADWGRVTRLDVPYLRAVRHPTGQAVPIALAPLTVAARRSLWAHASALPPPAALAAQRLTPAEIMKAAARPGEPFERQTRRPDNALLSRLPTAYTWDDLVLPEDTLAQLRALESQVRLRWTVYEDWGFSRLTHLGQGICALFGGRSGTGKTMAAQVMANSLGLDLLRVDLAGVVNKYIGETEKKLREVFDACEDSGALLFFDEADALFGNRTQVKDAHDRFANIEIDYLLQRIERFDGVAILATNRRQDLDPAFVRRLRFVIEFSAPSPAERLELWRRALVPCAPSGEAILGAIDYEYLAAALLMTGAEIKNTALAAAFLARAEGARIGMSHVFTAARREMAKQGERVRLNLREAAE
jgi:MoxR-like ATPase